MRPIDADAIKLPKGFFEKVNNVPKFYDWLNSLPTVDAEPEIICCEDCKYAEEGKPISDGRYWCKLYGSFMYYCSDAERRENELPTDD